MHKIPYPSGTEKDTVREDSACCLSKMQRVGACDEGGYFKAVWLSVVLLVLKWCLHKRSQK